ncbi:hypothetical protein, partial [Microbispora sp. NPDC046933]|uniref:hypothetical protein n=1 Tax=Microbispora sp. NPDC046933 TaxID=3155618 RepID=UPI0033E06153
MLRADAARAAAGHAWIASSRRACGWDGCARCGPAPPGRLAGAAVPRVVTPARGVARAVRPAA